MTQFSVLAESPTVRLREQSLSSARHWLWESYKGKGQLCKNANGIALRRGSSSLVGEKFAALVNVGTGYPSQLRKPKILWQRKITFLLVHSRNIKIKTNGITLQKAHSLLKSSTLMIQHFWSYLLVRFIHADPVRVILDHFFASVCFSCMDIQE